MIRVKGFYPPWKLAGMWEALKFAQDMYRSMPFEGQKAVDIINRDHVRGIKFDLKELETGEFNEEHQRWRQM